MLKWLDVDNRSEKEWADSKKTSLTVLDTSIEMLPLLIKQEVNSFLFFMSQKTEEAVIDLTLWKLSKLIGMMYILYKTVPTTEEIRVPEKKTISDEIVMRNRFCPTCKKTYTFKRCELCKRWACPISSFKEDERLTHLECYSKKYKKGKQWLKTQRETSTSLKHTGLKLTDSQQ